MRGSVEMEMGGCWECSRWCGMAVALDEDDGSTSRVLDYIAASGE